MNMATHPARSQTPITQPASAAVNYTLSVQPFTIPALIPPLVGGVLLWICFHPVAWGWLAWVGLVPLLGLVRSQARPRTIYLAAWLAGVAFFFPALHWMTFADPRMAYAWMALAGYCSLYFPGAVWLIRWLERRTALPVVLTVPVAWVGLEFVRSFLLSGFAWYYLGHSQHAFLALIQIVDLGGVYAVSFLIAAVNALIFDVLYQIEGYRRLFRLQEPARTKVSRLLDGVEIFGEIMPKRLFLETLGVVLFLAAALIYGHIRMDQAEFRPGPRIALLQGNLDKGIGDQASAPQAPEEAYARMFKHYYELCTMAAGQLSHPNLVQLPRPDLIIWPETSYPYPWHESSETPPARIPHLFGKYEIMIRNKVRELAEGSRTGHLLGMSAFVLDRGGKESRRNSAVLVTAQGNQAGRYDKVHRVPFGEYVPFKDSLPFMNAFAVYPWDYSIQAGAQLTRLPLKKYHFGVLICYEDTDPFLARQYAREQEAGPPVDFLVNMSNDGWFDGSSEHDEHLAISRFRAIETRRPLVRAVNMGISAVIDSNGVVQQPRQVLIHGAHRQWVVQEEHGVVPPLAESDWPSYKKVSGVIMATIPLDDRSSFYALSGDWLPGLCWLALGSVLGWAAIQRFRPSRVSTA